MTGIFSFYKALKLTPPPQCAHVNFETNYLLIAHSLKAQPTNTHLELQLFVEIFFFLIWFLDF